MIIDATMGNRIKELRIAAGLTQPKLAELAETTKNQLQKLEKGERRLSDHWAQRIAAHLGVQPFELFMTEGARVPVRFVPLIGSIQCGDWVEAVQTPEGQVPAINGGVNVFALRAQGDSMNRLITPEGYVYVDPDDRDMIDGKVYVVMNGDGEATAKMYRANPARLSPCSDNPVYQDAMLGGHPFTVIGRVVGTYSPL